MDATAIATRYITLWNEADAARRAALLTEGWMPNADYVDPIISGSGHAQINALIAGVQQRFPGYRFALMGKPECIDGTLRFSWSFGPAQDPGLLLGTDFAALEGERIARITGFLDKVPAAAA